MNNLKEMIKKTVDTAKFYKNASSDKTTLKFGYSRVIANLIKAYNYAKTINLDWININSEKPKLNTCYDLWIRLPNGKEERVVDKYFNGEHWFVAGNEEFIPLYNPYVTHYKLSLNPRTITN